MKSIESLKKHLSKIGMDMADKTIEMNDAHFTYAKLQQQLAYLAEDYKKTKDQIEMMETRERVRKSQEMVERTFKNNKGDTVEETDEK